MKALAFGQIGEPKEAGMLADGLGLFLMVSHCVLNLRGLNVGLLLALRDGMACCPGS